MKRSLRKEAARFGLAQQGATAIEFALIAAPLFTALGWIIEFGAMQFTEYTLQNAVETTSRELRVGTAMNDSAFVNAICGQISFPACNTALGISVKSGNLFADIDVPPVKDILPGSRTSFTPGGRGQAVVVVAVVDWDFVFPFIMQPFGNVDTAPGVRRLHGMAVFRNEP
jgi:Flp pilus assembly protein TadG